MTEQDSTMKETLGPVETFKGIGDLMNLLKLFGNLSQFANEHKQQFVDFITHFRALVSEAQGLIKLVNDEYNILPGDAPSAPLKLTRKTASE